MEQYFDAHRVLPYAGLIYDDKIERIRRACNLLKTLSKFICTSLNELSQRKNNNNSNNSGNNEDATRKKLVFNLNKCKQLLGEYEYMITSKNNTQEVWKQVDKTAETQRRDRKVNQLRKFGPVDDCVNQDAALWRCELGLESSVNSFKTKCITIEIDDSDDESSVETINNNNNNNNNNTNDNNNNNERKENKENEDINVIDVKCEIKVVNPMKPPQINSGNVFRRLTNFDEVFWFRESMQFLYGGSHIETTDFGDYGDPKYQIKRVTDYSAQERLGSGVYGYV